MLERTKVKADLEKLKNEERGMKELGNLFVKSDHLM
jgi:chaperonin cofactor prefoldin